MAIIHLSDDSFDSNVLNKEGLVVVDFWAEWCGPCRMLGPIFEKVSNDAAYGSITFCKANIDEAREQSTKYQVMSIPTLLCFHKGSIVSQKTGALNEDALKAFIDDARKKAGV